MRNFEKLTALARKARQLESTLLAISEAIEDGRQKPQNYTDGLNLTTELLGGLATGLEDLVEEEE